MDTNTASGPRSRKPWWTVTAVFDPDGTGSDFAYTEGLAARGLPEIHVWARPDQGYDPAADWKLSQSDTCRLLNEIAWRLIDDQISIGDTWEQEYDLGLAVAHFELGAPVEADTVEAYGARGAPVLPVRWSLERTPVGRTAALSREEKSELVWDYRGLTSTLPPATRLGLTDSAPVGWELPATPSASIRQAYGPRHALVLARAAQVWSADAEFWCSMVANACLHARHGGAGWAGVIARAAARAPGRVEALDRLEDAVHQLRDGLGVTWAVDELAEARQWLWPGDVSPQADQGWRSLVNGMGDCLKAYLMVEAVADVIPTQALTFGQGAVRGALEHAHHPSDDAWLAPYPVLQEVVDIYGRFGSELALDAARRWAAHVGDASAEISFRLMTGSCQGPPIQVQVGNPGADPAQTAAARREGTALFQHWTHALATVLTYGDELPPHVVEEFLEVSRAPAWLRSTVTGGRVRSRAS